MLGGRYRLLTCIGRGAMGEVWKGEHIALHTTFAIKLVDASAHRDGQEILERFKIEGQAAGRLRSPNIVQVFDYGTEGSTAYMAMELLEGETLADRLARVGRFSLADTARVMYEIAQGLSLAHEQGIIHRDLKPQNVFLARIAGRVTVKILDFGIAKLTLSAPVDTLKTSAGMMVGTPAYMSPEQIMGDADVSAQSDLWQLGVIAYECVTGRMPFDATSMADLFVRICSAPLPVPSKIAPVPESFDAWFAHAMQRVPEKRFRSAQEMADALADIVPEGHSRRTVQSDLFKDNALNSPWRDKERPADNKPVAVLVVLAVVSTLALISLAVITWIRRGKAEDTTAQHGASAILSAASTTAPTASQDTQTPALPSAEPSSSTSTASSAAPSASGSASASPKGKSTGKTTTYGEKVDPWGL